MGCADANVEQVLTLGTGTEQGQLLQTPGKPYNVLTIDGATDGTDFTVQVFCPGRRLFGKEQPKVLKNKLYTCPPNTTIHIEVRPPFKANDPLFVNWVGGAAESDVTFTFSNLSLNSLSTMLELLNP